MKAVQSLFVTTLFAAPTTVLGFCRNYKASASQPPFQVKQTVVTRVRLHSDFGTAMPEPMSVHEQLGIQPEGLALGINPDDVLAYIGTRDDLVKKTLEDIPKLNQTQAQVEVDKFLLDSEALTYYIEYQKRKAEDPDFAIPKEVADDGPLSFRNIIGVYLLYVASTTLPQYFKNYVASQQAAGTWQGTNIPFIDDWLANTASSAVSSSSSGVVQDTVQAISDAVQSSSGALQ